MAPANGDTTIITKKQTFTITSHVDIGFYRHRILSTLAEVVPLVERNFVFLCMPVYNYVQYVHNPECEEFFPLFLNKTNK